jgi:hypothetical protein
VGLRLPEPGGCRSVPVPAPDRATFRGGCGIASIRRAPLDAQYDASSVYIKSQVHAGWTPIKARYDDGQNRISGRRSGWERENLTSEHGTAHRRRRRPGN